MTPADRARVLREEADLIETDIRYGRVFRTITPAVLHARADRYEQDDTP